MQNNRFLRQEQWVMNLAAFSGIMIAFFAMNWLMSFIMVFISDISSDQIANCTVPLSSCIAPTVIFASLVFIAICGLGLPHRMVKKDVAYVLLVVFISWLLAGISFLFFDPPLSAVGIQISEPVFTVVRVFGSAWLSWLFSLLLLLVVGLGAYAGLAWKRRRILKGKVVPHYWWIDEDLPCLLTDYGCYVWVDKETGYKFSRYEEVISDEEE